MCLRWIERGISRNTRNFHWQLFIPNFFFLLKIPNKICSFFRLDDDLHAYSRLNPRHLLPVKFTHNIAFRIQFFKLTRIKMYKNACIVKPTPSLDRIYYDGIHRQVFPHFHQPRVEENIRDYWHKEAVKKEAIYSFILHHTRRYLYRYQYPRSV